MDLGADGEPVDALELGVGDRADFFGAAVGAHGVDPGDEPAEADRPGGLGRLTLTYIREQLAAIVARRRVDDPAISYVDGLTLYGPADAKAHPLPDNLHPDAATHQLIGKRFAVTLQAQPA